MSSDDYAYNYDTIIRYCECAHEEHMHIGARGQCMSLWCECPGFKPHPSLFDDATQT